MLTVNAHGSSRRQIEQMIADKVELSHPIGRHELQSVDGVDLVVDEAHAPDVGHVREHVGPDRAEIALLDAQQLNENKMRRLISVCVLVLCLPRTCT